MTRSESAEARKNDRAATLKKLPGLAPDDADVRLVHERMRLAIVSALAVNPTLTFTELKAMLELTDGNLSVHARKLEEGGLIQCTKSFVDRVPRSEYRITPRGRKALERYLGRMESLIKSVRRQA